MPETVREEIIAMGAEMAVHKTAKQMRRTQMLLVIALAVAIFGNAVGWAINLKVQHADCLDRQARVEATRSLWHAVFDEIEKNGGSDPVLDRLQLIVDEKLPPLNC